MKLILTILIAFLTVSCGSNRPVPSFPTPPPTEAPTSAPPESPSPSASPTPVVPPAPVSVPVVNLAPYLHEQGGRVVDITIQDGEDVGLVVNVVDSFEGPGKLIIRSGSSRKIINTPITLKHDSEWVGEFACDTETADPWLSCIYVHNNTKHEGANATIFGPTSLPRAKHPAVTVFMAHQQHRNNYFESENITIRGFKMIGRQIGDDGGMRSVMNFGNCVNCAAIENDFFDVASIGITLGGGAAEGKHAKNGMVYRNKLRRFSAAAIALVNVDGAVVAENDLRDPARKTGGEGEQGGISAIDIETNNTDDCARNIKIFNNRIGYGHSKMHVAGNGILGQNVYSTNCSGGLLIANNIIDGWEGNNSDSTQWGLASGLYFVGIWPESLIVSNVIIRAQHGGVSFYGTKYLTLKDNLFVTVGGGGIHGLMLYGASDNSFAGNRLVHDAQIKGSVDLGTWCGDGSINNRFERHEPLPIAECFK